MKARILFIEDDPEMSSFTKILLTNQNYKVQTVETAEEGLEIIRRQPPDLLISDVQLPGLSGVKLCEILKSEARTASLPIILLTVLGTNYDKVKGLKMGADDYLTKPYSSDELLARVEALLRRVRHAGVPVSVLELKDLKVDLDRRVVTLRGKPIVLRRKEYELLVLLMQKPGQVLTRDFIVNILWKDDSIVGGNTLNVHIKNLREKLGPYKDAIQTLIGQGYKLDEDF